MTDSSSPFQASDLDADFDSASQLLLQHAGKELALISAWLARPNATALLAVAEAKGTSLIVRKAAEKGLAVLRNKKITPKRPPRVAKMFEPEVASIEAYSLFPDGEGNNIVWITSSGGPQGVRLVEVTVNDRTGLDAIRGGATSLGRVKQMFADWKKRADRAPFKVPLAFARARIAAACAKAVAQKRVLPMELNSLSDLVGDLKNQVVAHPLDAEGLVLPTDAAEIAKRIEASGAHFADLPEVKRWMPEGRYLQQLFQTLPTDLQQVRSPLSPELRARLHVAVGEEGADGYFNDERRPLFIDRFKDVALSLLAAGDREGAIDALLVSDRLQKSGVVSDRPSEIPFIRRMFTRWVDNVFPV